MQLQLGGCNMPSTIMKDQTEILCLRLLNDEISISCFELELYKIKEDSQLYEDLVLLNFQSKFIVHETRKVIKSHLKKNEIEFYQINQLLNDIIENNDNAFKSLLKTYDLRCNGYWFFEELGMALALRILSSKDELITKIEDLPPSVQNEFHQEILPKAIAEAKRIRNLLATKQIILTGETNGELSRKVWIDNRAEDSISEEELETIKFHSHWLERTSRNKKDGIE